MTEKYFCPSSCLCFHDGEVKGACNVCSHKADTVYEESLWGIAFDEVVEIYGESKTEYYLADGGSVLKSAVQLEKRPQTGWTDEDELDYQINSKGAM